jgi:RHS repeat-associated protein
MGATRPQNPGRYVYDAAGNMTAAYDGLSIKNYTYDAENRISTAAGNTYTYDVNGMRVRKQTDANNFTEYVYFGSNVIAEKQVTSGGAPVWTDYIFAGGKRIAKVQVGTDLNTDWANTQFYHGDHLGSARLMTAYNGTTVPNSEATYLPFGQEWNPQSSTNHFKFTGKERDAESGLDYFGARYLGSIMGRWMSPDPLLTTGRPLMPQSWNRYAYVLNAPLQYVDATGLYERDVHEDLTNALALAVGFDVETARQIGRATQGVDEDPATDPTRAKNLVGDRAVQMRADFHFTSEERRDHLWQNFETAKTVSSLGVYLHAFEDSFAHAGFGAKYGHASAGTAPDKTANDAPKADKMARAVYDQLLQAARIMGTTRKSVAWEKIDGLVQQFNRSTSAIAKKRIIEQIRQIIFYGKILTKEYAKPEQNPPK